MPNGLNTPINVTVVVFWNAAIDKLVLYASMKIPEFWRFNGSVLRVYSLTDEQYTEVESSPTYQSEKFLAFCNKIK